MLPRLGTHFDLAVADSHLEAGLWMYRRAVEHATILEVHQLMLSAALDPRDGRACKRAHFRGGDSTTQRRMGASGTTPTSSRLSSTTI